MATAQEIVGLLRARYSLPEWALVTEVANGTGGRATRRADAVGMNLWPSRGMEVHGFEIKVRREDWLAELKNPQKADEIARYCDYWWLVVGHRDVCGGGECPTTWGMLHVSADGKSLGVAREPSKLDPVPLDRGFLASLLRRALQQLPPEVQIRKAIDGAVSEALNKQHQDFREEIAAAVAQWKSLVEGFQEKSGINLRTYAHGQFPDELRQYLRNPKSYAERVANDARELVRAAEELKRVAAAMGAAPRGDF